MNQIYKDMSERGADGVEYVTIGADYTKPYQIHLDRTKEEENIATTYPRCSRRYYKLVNGKKVYLDGVGIVEPVQTKKKIGFYGGSFDPFHNGHLDMVSQSLAMFDEVHIVIAKNEKKGTRFLPIKNTIRAIKKSILDEMPCYADRIHIDTLPHRELLGDFANDTTDRDELPTLIRGVRNPDDFVKEQSLAEINRDVCGINTVFLLASNNKSHISSSLIRTLFTMDKDYSRYVPDYMFLEVEEHGGYYES